MCDHGAAFRYSAPLSLLLLLMPPSIMGWDHSEFLEDVLAADDECAMDGEGCALNVLQFPRPGMPGHRGKVVATSPELEAPAQSCLASGCGVYDASRQCQCNFECQRFMDCCTDFANACEQHDLGTIHGHPTPGKVYPVREGFTLTLVEEFDHPLDLDADPIWTWSDGGLSEGKVRFAKEGIRFEDGKVKLHLDLAPDNQPQQCSHAEVGLVTPKSLLGGELRTKNNNFRYGYYEARIKVPSVQPGHTEINGNYITAFMLFRDGKFKHWRELDIEITGAASNFVNTSLMFEENTAVWHQEMSDEEEHVVNTNLREDFHTYGIEWLPHRVRWFVDGEVVRESVGEKIAISTLSAKIILNLWVFSDLASFGGEEIWNNRYPMEAECDWIRFYKWDGDEEYPCAGLGTECLTEDDWYLSSNNPCDQIHQTGTVAGRVPCQAECKHE